MARSVLVRSIVLSIACIGLAETDAAAQQYAGECRVWFYMQNRYRHVWGDVEAECTYTCFPLAHSHLWGNWGVESVWNHRNDGTQFPGWKSDGCTAPCCENISSDKPQWNSCTTDASRPRGNPYWFNDNNSTEQRSDPEATYASSIYTFQNSCPADWDGDGWADTGGCWAGGSGISTTDFIETWEIDPHDFDERIMRIDYPMMSAWYHCEPDAVTCWPESPSPWTPSNGGSYMDAEARLVIWIVQWEDFGCCSNGTWICF